MNCQQIKTLFTINLLYANPQVTRRQRDKKRTNKSLTRSILFQYSLSAIILLLVFSIQMLMIDLPHYPGYFTFYCALFALMTFSQAVSALHNIFYESKDLQDYLPLPFTNTSIFFVKFLAVGFIVLPFLVPVLALFVITGLRATGILGLFLALVAFVLFFLLFLLLSTWIVSLLVQSKLFQRYKKIASLFLTFIPLIGVIGGMTFLNLQVQQVDYTVRTLPDRPVLLPFLPFHDWLVHPFSLISLISLLIILALLAGLYFLIRKVTIPQMFRILLDESVSAPATKSHKAAVYKNFPQQLFHYNLGLLKNPTLWIQTLTGSFVFPIAMLAGSASSGNLNLSGIPPKYFSVFFIVGLAFALISINNSSIVAMIISLDRENFSYIQSLPLHLKTYLRAKFHFAFGLQLLLDLVILLIISLILRLSPLLILGTLLGDILGVYLTSLHYFARDWRLLTLNWTAVSQLYTRGTGGFALFFVFFGTFIGAGLVIGLAAFLLSVLPFTFVINFVLLLLLIGGAILVELHYRKRFWKLFR